MKNKFQIVGIRNTPFMVCLGLLESYKKKIEGTKCQIEKAMMFGHGTAVKTCYNDEDRIRIKHIMEEEVKKGFYTQIFFDNIDATYKNSVKEIKKFKDINFSECSVQELIKYLDIYYQIYITTLHPMVWAIYGSDLIELFEKEFIKVVKKINKKQLVEMSALLLTPTRLTTVQKEEQELWELQNDFESNYKTNELKKFLKKKQNKFKNLEKNYGWFHMEYIGEPWTAKDYIKHFEKRIIEGNKDDWKSSFSPKQRLKKTIKAQNDFFSTYPNSELLQKIVFTMQELLIVLDFSKADLIEGLYYGRLLLSEIAKRTNAKNWVDIRYYLLYEIDELLLKGEKVNEALIKERKKWRLIVLRDGNIDIYSGEEAKIKGNTLLVDEISKDQTELKGVLAYPGKVKGRAKVLTSYKDLNKIEEGDIMITHDTTTELTSAIKKSAAIVADQGTILSHTSIVAREFKIPCLIQTKIATKVFKDGDLVEVDANKGIVRKLN